jgi:hypothetical protein
MRAAHNQLAVYEEGRGDDHPEADALVHVQLTCGLALLVCRMPAPQLKGAVALYIQARYALLNDFERCEQRAFQAGARSSAGR